MLWIIFSREVASRTEEGGCGVEVDILEVRWCGLIEICMC
jgi:hypothetical protein